MATQNWDANYRNLTIKMSDGTVASGKLNLQTYNRISDMLKLSNEQFITLVPEPGCENSPQAIIINKQYIVWAEAYD